MNRDGSASLRGHVVALLGPTNTGKTDLAIRTMLSHASGIIGFPLRLLAREVYDRVCAEVGRSNTALVTGEEKIIPPNPHYFLCTVEAMPGEPSFDFVGVDEIQLAADPERGHVFTDRLLNARGRETTMFMGSDVARPLIRRMLPDIMMTGRPRLSSLTYAGKTRLSRLPRRSAIVGFSANDVYAIAELVRRHRGGAAVVLGALSPRTRNAQVAMYQAGEVDFLVATDAIGMGLNMDIDHVAFAGAHKFDGARRRALTPAEVGQIAGRAGRFMRNGGFGVTGEVADFDEDMIAAVENHHFAAESHFRWRARRLDFDNPRALLRSLETPPPRPWLIPPRQAEDMMTLKALLKDETASAAAAANRENLILLWRVCEIPDFRKTMRDSHVRLLGRIYRHLVERGSIRRDWIARHLQQLDRTDGDLDTLQARTAHVRTWTFVSHRAEWLDDAAEWQGRARAIEDRLSDALHDRLTQRFVDRRTTSLVRKLRDSGDIIASVSGDGAVMAEGQQVGRLLGLRFVADHAAPDNKAMKAAVNHVLGRALKDRARKAGAAADAELALLDGGYVAWRGEKIARLQRSDSVLKPQLRLLADDQLADPERTRLQSRIGDWLRAQMARLLKPLLRLQDAEFSPPARAVAFRLIENLGVIERQPVAAYLAQFDSRDFGRFKYRGVTLGRSTIFCAALLKPETARWRHILFHCGDDAPAPPDHAGLVSFEAGAEAAPEALLRAGYKLMGPVAVRVDMLERIDRLAYRATRQGPAIIDHEIQSLLGGGGERLAPVLAGLGYASAAPAETGEPRFCRAPRKNPRAKGPRAKNPHAKGPHAADKAAKQSRAARKPAFDPDSPFAALAVLKSK